jgi:hypothetical protein
VNGDAEMTATGGLRTIEGVQWAELPMLAELGELVLTKRRAVDLCRVAACLCPMP